jgi:hypothetical protein
VRARSFTPRSSSEWAGSVQAWRVGDERAETYLGLLAEAELRRAGDQLRRLDAAAEDVSAHPGMAPLRTLESAAWKVARAGLILVAAGVLEQDYLDYFVSDLHAAIMVRSRLLLNWDRRRGMRHSTIFAPPDSRPPSRGVSQAMRAAPVGAALRVAGSRAAWTLHFLSFVRAETKAVITVAMHMLCRRTDRVRIWSSPGPGRTICRTTSSGRWTSRGPATRSGSRAARAGRPPGSASPRCHPCPARCPAARPHRRRQPSHPAPARTVCTARPPGRADGDRTGGHRVR